MQVKLKKTYANFNDLRFEVKEKVVCLNKDKMC